MSEVDINFDDAASDEEALEIEEVQDDEEMVDEEDLLTELDEGSVTGEDGDGENADEEASSDGEKPDEAPDAESKDTPEGEQKPAEQTDKELEKDPIKGTKLDEDPLTRANQIARNASAAYEAEQRKTKLYEQILRNPDALKAFQAKLTGEAPVEIPKPLPFQVPERKFKDASQLQTPQDLWDAIEERDRIARAEFANTLAAELEKVRGSVKDLTSREQQRLAMAEERETSIRAASGALADMQQAAQKFSFLKEDSEDFSPEARDAVTKAYIKADYNPQTKKFMGNTKFSEIAGIFSEALKASAKRAQQAAKTTIVDKTVAAPTAGNSLAGKTFTPVQVNKKMSPEAFIAQRIRASQRARGGRN